MASKTTLKIALRDLVDAIESGDWEQIDQAILFAESLLEKEK